MGCHKVALFVSSCIVLFDSNNALLDRGTRHNAILSTRGQCDQTFWIWNSFVFVKQLEPLKVVNVHLSLKNHDDFVATEFDGLDIAFEGELTNASSLMIVPEHDFVWWEARILPTPNNAQNIAPVEHGHNADSAIGKIPLEGLLERLAIVDAEAFVCATRKAAVVLIEAHKEQVRLWICDGQLRHEWTRTRVSVVTC